MRNGMLMLLIWKHWMTCTQFLPCWIPLQCWTMNEIKHISNFHNRLRIGLRRKAQSPSPVISNFSLLVQKKKRSLKK